MGSISTPIFGNPDTLQNHQGLFPPSLQQGALRMMALRCSIRDTPSYDHHEVLSKSSRSGRLFQLAHVGRHIIHILQKQEGKTEAIPERQPMSYVAKTDMKACLPHSSQLLRQSPECSYLAAFLSSASSGSNNWQPFRILLHFHCDRR